LFPGADGPYGGRGIYPVASLMNHSCVCNTRNIISGTRYNTRIVITGTRYNNRNVSTETRYNTRNIITGTRLNTRNIITLQHQEHNRRKPSATLGL